MAYFSSFCLSPPEWLDNNEQMDSSSGAEGEEERISEEVEFALYSQVHFDHSADPSHECYIGGDAYDANVSLISEDGSVTPAACDIYAKKETKPTEKLKRRAARGKVAKEPRQKQKRLRKADSDLVPGGLDQMLTKSSSTNCSTQVPLRDKVPSCALPVEELERPTTRMPFDEDVIYVRTEPKSSTVISLVDSDSDGPCLLDNNQISLSSDDDSLIMNLGDISSKLDDDVKLNVKTPAGFDDLQSIIDSLKGKLIIHIKCYWYSGLRDSTAVHFCRIMELAMRSTAGTPKGGQTMIGSL